MSRPLSYDSRHALNAICPYFTMFPVEFPLRVLNRHKSSSPVVMDPFCGRGTTIYASRVLGLDSWGIDSSPIAVAIAQAKLAKINAKAVLELAQFFIETHVSPEMPCTVFFQQAFNREVLRQICAIRQGLLQQRRETNASVILRATMLGCERITEATGTAWRFVRVDQSVFEARKPKSVADLIVAPHAGEKLIIL
jgi:tRNA G10  N-methylase Trm11